MLIEKIAVKNFKSIKEMNLELNPLSMIVGTNAS